MFVYLYVWIKLIRISTASLLSSQVVIINEQKMPPVSRYSQRKFNTCLYMKILNKHILNTPRTRLIVASF